MAHKAFVICFAISKFELADVIHKQVFCDCEEQL